MTRYEIEIANCYFRRDFKMNSFNLDMVSEEILFNLKNHYE